MRRRLAEMDARSLRDVGISPAAAAYESGKPFWAEDGLLALSGMTPFDSAGT